MGGVVQRIVLKTQEISCISRFDVRAAADRP